MKRLLTAAAIGMMLAVGTAASSAQADAPQPYGSHLTWDDCYRKGNAGLNFAWVDYYCTTDWLDTKFILLMVYYPE